ncbi:MAG: hypothetical protein R2825_10965 [Saprospiraceae bacterium]
MAASKGLLPFGTALPIPFPTTFFLSQLGPDGRMYINTTNGVLHAAHDPVPNKERAGLRSTPARMLLPTYNAFTMPHFPNYRPQPSTARPATPSASTICPSPSSGTSRIRWIIYRSSSPT